MDLRLNLWRDSPRGHLQHGDRGLSAIANAAVLGLVDAAATGKRQCAVSRGTLVRARLTILLLAAVITVIDTLTVWSLSFVGLMVPYMSFMLGFHKPVAQWPDGGGARRPADDVRRLMQAHGDVPQSNIRRIADNLYRRVVFHLVLRCQGR